MMLPQSLKGWAMIKNELERNMWRLNKGTSFNRLDDNAGVRSDLREIVIGGVYNKVLLWTTPFDRSFFRLSSMEKDNE